MTRRVWYCIPTAAPIEQAWVCLEAWRDMGYGTAILVEDEARRALPADCCVVQDAYHGYCESVNLLAGQVLTDHPECQIVVTGGDDVYPCQDKRAAEIADEFIEHFGGTLGVMQPHGDDSHHRQRDGSYALDTAAWSPWMGRAWCERAYMGNGPMHPGFFHYYSSTNLQQVAEWLGLYWTRPDIIQRDDNWKRSSRQPLGRPPYLEKAKAMGAADRELAEWLKKAGFPGCGLLPAP